MSSSTQSCSTIQNTIVPSAAAHGLKKTTRRVLTRRAVMWLGQTCNLRCYFCYFIDRIQNNRHPGHAFMSGEKAKRICSILRNFYGCTSIDIQGGEPTIHPDIFEIVEHCQQIGLHPTLITNGLRLAVPGEVQRFKEAGVRDFLVSLHGIEDVHDEVVGRPGAYRDIITGLDAMREQHVLFRFNCTMSKPVVPLLPDIARKALEYQVPIVNFIAFNPFGDQEIGRRTAENTPRYSTIRGPLEEAIALLESNGVEVNVRYLPLCFAARDYRKNFYNYQQLPYDIHEWDYESWLWSMLPPQMMKAGEILPPFRIGPFARMLWERGEQLSHDIERHAMLQRLFFPFQRKISQIWTAIRGRKALYHREGRLRAQKDCKYQHPAVCEHCALRAVCDGFHGDYAHLFGMAEAQPVEDMPCITDPAYFIREQEKYVEPEEQEWAL